MATQEQPNILLVMADQLAPQFTGAYGHRIVKTPNLDRLAERGVRFDAAYSPCPICAPARACMMTGQYTSTNGVYDNGAPLASDNLTFAHALTLAGYDTVLSGKMHFVGPDQLHGFRARFVRNIYPADFRWTASREGPPVRQPLAFGERPGNFRHAWQYLASGVHVGSYNGMLAYDEETQFRAIEYLRVQGHRQREAIANGREYQPFLLCASFHHPHPPFHAPEEFWNLYKDADIDLPEYPENLEETYSTLDRWANIMYSADEIDIRKPEDLRVVRRAYYALTSYIDHKLGQLLDTLRQYGLDRNTVVVFTSDHGEMLGEKGMIQKCNFYEHSARVPLVVSFPDGRGAGRVVREPVNLVDIAPTLCDIGAVDPEIQQGEFDGTTLLPLIDGQSQPDRVTFSEMHTNCVYSTCFMVRQGSYKYTHVTGHDRQLFDLSTDPGEWNNLADTDHGRAVADRMRTLLEERFDIEAIERDAAASVKRRKKVQQALVANRYVWDVSPQFPVGRDCFWQYLP